MKAFRWVVIVMLSVLLTGCFYWWRAYQTYLQMDEFDKNFSINAGDDFSVYFKNPLLYSSDFIDLAKLQPSQIEKTAQGEVWHYQFRKIDAKGAIIFPEIGFSVVLAFNQDKRIVRCTFSSLFLQIAPPQFLELSIRSIGRGEINKITRQLKVDTDNVRKINAALPLKKTVINHLGRPLEIIDQQISDIYIYHFILETPAIESGYEERRLSVIKLTFNKTSQEMTNMAGSFAGLKISINYQKYQKKTI